MITKSMMIIAPIGATPHAHSVVYHPKDLRSRSSLNKLKIYQYRLNSAANESVYLKSHRQYIFI